MESSRPIWTRGWTSPRIVSRGYAEETVRWVIRTVEYSEVQAPAGCSNPEDYHAHPRVGTGYALGG